MNDRPPGPEPDHPALVPAGSRVVMLAVQGASPGGHVAVKKGERVVAGQCLFGVDTAPLPPGAIPAVAVHSPTSGKVTDIQPVPTGSGMGLAAIVESDGLDERAAALPRPWDGNSPESWPREELVSFLRQAGIEGRFTTAVLRDEALDVPASLSELMQAGLGGGVLVVNAAASEPMMETEAVEAALDPDRVVLGARALAHALGAGQVLIAAVGSSPAFGALKEALGRAGEPSSPEVRLVDLKTLDWREVPILIARRAIREASRTHRPRRAGAYAVEAAGTAVAAARALMDGEPFIERRIGVRRGLGGTLTVVRVPLGVSAASLVTSHGHAGAGSSPDGALAPEAAGGLLLAGGPMTGAPLSDAEAPVTKSMPGLTFVAPRDVARFHPEAPCIRCGRCVEVCPAGLLPLYIARAAGAGHMPEARDFGAAACVECGACAAVCPSGRPLVQWIRLARAPRARRPVPAVQEVVTSR